MNYIKNKKYFKPINSIFKLAVIIYAVNISLTEIAVIVFSVLYDYPTIDTIFRFLIMITFIANLIFWEDERIPKSCKSGIIILEIISSFSCIPVTIIYIILGIEPITINFVLRYSIFAICCFVLLSQISGRPKDSEIDDAVEMQLEDIKERALMKLGVDEDEVKEIAPISFGGYVFDNFTLIAKGSDGIYRSSKYRSVMLFFSDNEVYCFTSNFSLIENNHTDATSVYFYKDIVSVSTQTETADYSVGIGKRIRVDYDYFELTTTGGTSISCTVNSLDDAQRSINGMRSLIRSKKMA